MNHESINITRELVLQHCSALFRIHIYSLIYIYMRCDLGEIPKHTYTRCAVCGQQFAYASWALARSTFCTDIYTLSFASSTRSCNMLKCSHLWCVWHGFGVYAATEMPLWLSYNTHRRCCEYAHTVRRCFFSFIVFFTFGQSNSWRESQRHKRTHLLTRVHTAIVVVWFWQFGCSIYAIIPRGPRVLYLFAYHAR